MKARWLGLSTLLVKQINEDKWKDFHPPLLALDFPLSQPKTGLEVVVDHRAIFSFQIVVCPNLSDPYNTQKK